MPPHRLACLAAAAVLLAAPAGAVDRHLTLLNRTGIAITALYAAPSATDPWDTDILGRPRLGSGEAAAIDLRSGDGGCRFDFKAVFADGSSQVKTDVDVCHATSFAYGP